MPSSTPQKIVTLKISRGVIDAGISDGRDTDVGVSGVSIVPILTKGLEPLTAWGTAALIKNAGPSINTEN